jgi:uncharacterized protein
MGRFLAKMTLVAAVVAAMALGGSMAAGAIASDALLKGLREQGLVSDYAGVLGPADRTALEKHLTDLQQKTSVQFAVVVLKSLEGGEVNDFANKLFAKWGVGVKGKNNGVMLLVAMQDCKARVEVGYGLEPVLPDALAGRVLDEQLFPAFKQQRYGQGLTQAVGRIVEIIERNEPATPEQRRGVAGQTNIIDTVGTILFLSMFVALGFGVFGAGVSSGHAFLLLWGAGFGGIPLLISLAESRAGFAVLCVIAVVTFIVGALAARRVPPSNLRRRHGGSGRRWTSIGDGLFGGGFGGGGFGSGGFGGGGGGGGFGGFGGGCSGGGGASGGW